MKTIALIVVALSTCVLCYGKTISFTTADNQNIPQVRCVGYSEGNDSVASWVSGEDGVINIQEPVPHHIVATHANYNDKIIYSSDLGTDNNIIVLTPTANLSEVVVTPKDMEEFATHRTYRISKKDMARYATVLESLNVIPNMTVLANGQMFYEGSSDIKILIDGVDASSQELQTLSKDDIASVDVYQTPPLRFISQGVSAVLDIKLKSSLRGGNGAININQAFQSLKGNNNAALYYNFKRSRFSLRYYNNNIHLRKYRQSEVLDYEFGDVRYKKIKEGLDSKYHSDNNNVILSYQVNKPKDFLYNIKAGIDIDRTCNDANQNVKTSTESFLATNMLHTAYNKFIVGNYFEKHFGDNGGTFMANVNYQHYTTTYNSAYNEQSNSEWAINDSRSNYKTHLDAVISEIQYELPTNKLGQFSASVFESYKHNKYIDTSFPFYQAVNTLVGAVQWVGMKGNVIWNLSMGAEWLYSISTNLNKTHSLITIVR